MMFFNFTDANANASDPKPAGNYGIREALWSTWNQATHKNTFQFNH